MVSAVEEEYLAHLGEWEAYRECLASGVGMATFFSHQMQHLQQGSHQESTHLYEHPAVREIGISGAQSWHCAHG